MDERLVPASGLECNAAFEVGALPPSFRLAGLLGSVDAEDLDLMRHRYGFEW